ncbi:MAG: hypothetical protein ACRDZX_05480 [Acidimicrobiales bacterium]
MTTLLAPTGRRKLTGKPPLPPALSLRYEQGERLARPIWFGPEGRPAFGWFHSPAGDKCRGGVVICPPLGQEHIDAHYGLRLLAEQLAVAGICALRFDYDGTGDSAGDNDDPARVSSWLATVEHAVAAVRAAGAANVCLVGLRLGATLAATAAATTGDIDQVVLWDPCSGRQFLREQKALRAMQFGAPPGMPEGSVELLGVRFGPATARAVNALDLAGCSLPVARRALVLTRPDRPGNPSFTAGFGRELTERGEAEGQAKFMDRYPPFQRLPRGTISRVTQWLCEGAPPQRTLLKRPPVAGPHVVGYTPSGHGVVETPVSIPPLGLFGIVTHLDTPQRPKGPTVLLLNVANQHHIGPTRLWVELARQWAGAGLVSLRVDLSGLGDSPARPGDDRWIFAKPAAFDDVEEVARCVSPDDPSNIVLVGLCSAGYQALEGALALRSRGVVAVNTAVSFVPAERRARQPLDPRRRVALPQDQVAEAFREGGRLGGLRQRFPNLAWRARILGSPKTRSGRWLTDLVRNGTDTFLICGDDEWRPVRSGVTALQLRRLRRTGRLRLEHIAGLQHDLFVTEHRRLVARLVTGYVVSKFANPA